MVPAIYCPGRTFITCLPRNAEQKCNIESTFWNSTDSATLKLSQQPGAHPKQIWETELCFYRKHLARQKVLLVEPMQYGWTHAISKGNFFWYLKMLILQRALQENKQTPLSSFVVLVNCSACLYLSILDNSNELQTVTLQILPWSHVSIIKLFG